MKIGVIGGGNWGRNIVRTLNEMGVLGGLAEMNPALRESYAADYPELPLFEDLKSLLATSPDGVAVATPVPTHHQVGKAILEADIDVFIEKPLAFSTGEAEELVRIADEKGRVLMVGHLLLYQPAVVELAKRLREGFLGEVFSLHQRRAKLGKARDAENALWSLGVHDLAVLLHLAGETPSSVQASGHAGLQDGIEDDVYLHLGFASGLKAHLHSSWLWPENSRSLIVVGEKGMLVYDEVAQTLTHHRKTITEDLQNQDDGEELVYEGSGQPLTLELQHFMDCIRTRDTPRSCGQGGLEVVRIIEQACESLRNSS